jgi:hypothetical protein
MTDGQSIPRPKHAGGRPKGSKGKSNGALAKEAARELTRTIVTNYLRPMLRSQIASAIGIGHLYTRDAAGKFNRVVKQAQVDRLLKTGTQGRHYFIYAKDPSTQAFTDLMNRAIDKPKDQPVEVGVVADVTYKWED